jgi:hypothetical protein
MNCKVFVLAVAILIGSSCKHKEETINTPPPQETPPPQTPQPKPDGHESNNHNSHDHDGDHGEDHDHDDDCHCHKKHCHKKHKLPPGQEKKLHGDQSARDYAPGHKKHH